MLTTIKLREVEQIPPEKIICFDVETTGLDPENDEILQLSIVDGVGNVLFSDYIKPEHKDEWIDAERIHGISPAMVEHKKPFSEIKDDIQQIFNGALLIVGYNNISFDNFFLKSAGIVFSENAIFFDVMHAFAPIYGEWNNYFRNFKWQKLITCCRYFEYEGCDNWHDSLVDVQGTLFCFFKMRSLKYGYFEDEEELLFN